MPRSSDGRVGADGRNASEWLFRVELAWENGGPIVDRSDGGSVVKLECSLVYDIVYGFSFDEVVLLRFDDICIVVMRIDDIVWQIIFVWCSCNLYR
ncbi:hypothetical protein KM043_007807 [Ampulex compressa]|nr:hypothetical protein KM043_007807 [Ampulex compressa]